MNKLTVDFVVAGATDNPTLPMVPVVARQSPRETPSIGKCSCGSQNFALASELEANVMTGIPASRMFECIACGEYRLA